MTDLPDWILKANHPPADAHHSTLWLRLNHQGIDDSKFTELIQIAISNSPLQIESLNMSGSAISDGSLGLLSDQIAKGKFRGLRSLKVNSTSITDNALHALAHAARSGGLSSLRSLDLGGTELSDIGLVVLFKSIESGCLPSLRNLELGSIFNMTDSSVLELARISHSDCFSKLDLLDLNSNAIGEDSLLPLLRSMQLGNFPELRQLELSSTELTDATVVKAIGSTRSSFFSKLHDLELGATQIGDATITGLFGAASPQKRFLLRGLGLACTRITDIALKTIANAIRRGRLTNLNVLALHRTLVSDLGIAAFTESISDGSCRKLNNLSLGHTSVSDTGLIKLAKSAQAGNLRLLEMLHLDEAAISDFGLIELARAAEGGFLPNLKRLSIIGTRVSVGQEAMWTQNPEVIFRAILNGSRQSSARVMLLGMGDVGKSWLGRRCFGDELIDPQIEKRAPTHDISLSRDLRCDWLKLTDLPDAVTANVWDFGGQLILHGVHEIFLANDKRTVYLLVMDAKRVPGNGSGQTDATSGNRLDYWLKTIRHFGGDSAPIIIGITKCDAYQHDPTCDRPIDTLIGIGDQPIRLIELDPMDLGSHYHVNIDAIIDRLSATCNGVEYQNGLKHLREAICKAISELKDVREGKVPPEVPPLIEVVRQKCKSAPMFPLRDFRESCAELGSYAQRPSYQDSLLKILHYSGELFYFGSFDSDRDSLDDGLSKVPPGQLRLLQSQQHYLLQNYVFSPGALKQCVYDIVRASESTSQQGWFDAATIDDFASSGLRSLHPTFTEIQIFQEAIRVFLELVQLSWYDKTKRKFLFPRGLGLGTPYGSASWHSTKLQWDYFPEANFHRLLVELHEASQVVFEEGKWQHFRYAVLAKHRADQQTRVAIVANPEEGLVELRFDPAGDTKLWDELLNQVVVFFENSLHMPRLDDRPTVPRDASTSRKSISRQSAIQILERLRSLSGKELMAQLEQLDLTVPELTSNQQLWLPVADILLDGIPNKRHFTDKRKKGQGLRLNESFGIDNSAQIWRALGQRIYYLRSTIDLDSYQINDAGETQ